MLVAIQRVMAKEYPHATRARYVAQRCRCDECRAANAAYWRGRYQARKAGDWNGLVDATPAREHIRKLSRAGVGYMMVADAAKTAVSVIQDIKSGARTRARARTVRRILAVSIDCRGDGTQVSAASTWRRIEKLVEEGFRKRDLARLLGYECEQLQFGKTRVTVRTRARIERLFEKLTT